MSYYEKRATRLAKEYLGQASYFNDLAEAGRSRTGLQTATRAFGISAVNELDDGHLREGAWSLKTKRRVSF
jgi:hypothetical protein